MLEIGADGIKVGDVGDDFAFAANEFTENALAGAALESWDEVLEPGEVKENALEAVVRFAARVGLIAAHDSRLVRAAHGTGS